MTEKDRIGARVARLRKGRGLSQIGLARRAGMSHSLLSKVEAGHVPASPVFIDREIVHSAPSGVIIPAIRRSSEENRADLQRTAAGRLHERTPKEPGAWGRSD